MTGEFERVGSEIQGKKDLNLVSGEFELWGCQCSITVQNIGAGLGLVYWRS